MSLVIAGDFLAAVKRRLTEGPLRDAYTEERGAGVVAAKTMRTDGGVHVLRPFFLFVVPEAAEDDETAQLVRQTATARKQQALRTVLHEAQHVGMGQRGEDTTDAGTGSWREVNFLGVAREIISEYRAELAVPASLRFEWERTFPSESLGALPAAFYQAAAVDYQAHLDVSRLAADVLQPCLHAWKALADHVAARRAFGVPVGDPLPGEVTDSVEWKWMADGFWQPLELSLEDVPPGNEIVDPASLAQTVTALATLFNQWMEFFGFRWTDERFDIVSWDLVLPPQEAR